MAQVEIAGAELSALVERVVAGEEIILARDGRALARIIALPRAELRRPGVAPHWVFDDEALMVPMDPEGLDAAEGLHTDEFGLTLPERT